MRFNPVSAALFGLVCMLGAGAAYAEGVVAPCPSLLAQSSDVGAEELLKRMASAMQTTNYEGLLLHMRGGEARSMRVFHRYDAEHGEREHLVSLDGKPFEVVQDSQGCTCVWPQSRLVVVGHTPAFNGRLFTERFAEAGSLGAFYAISLQGQARVGGIGCRLVRLAPRDAYRFGYRLCIHEPSAMLLNLEVFNGERRLELSQFTQLRMRKEADTDDMRLFSNIDGFRVVEDKPEAPLQGEGRAAFKSGWLAAVLPPGYVQRSAELRSTPHRPKPLEQLIFSDGLSSVSVFIERLDAPEPAANEGKPHPRGVMQRVVREVDGYRLTAVGDAPEAAMRMMLEGMQPVTPRSED